VRGLILDGEFDNIGMGTVLQVTRRLAKFVCRGVTTEERYESFVRRVGAKWNGEEVATVNNIIFFKKEQTEGCTCLLRLLL
jgi:hypothetical protein